ncbi:MAG: ABC transporter permease [Microbacterium sp.]
MTEPKTGVTNVVPTTDLLPGVSSVRRPMQRLTIGPVLAGIVVLVVIGWALLPGLFAPYDPYRAVPADRLQPPSFTHPLGTDPLGRDLFSRMIEGSTLTLQASLLAVFIALVVGSLIGLISGYVGGRADTAIMRVIDVLQAIPSLLLALVLITALGFGTLNVAIAVGIGSIAAFARLMRAETVRVRNSAYVEAAGALGVRTPGVLGRHVLPNSTGPVLALATLELGTAILAISALSFLGFGAVPPAAEWGSLVSEGRVYQTSAWWLTTLPGLIIVATVLAFNRLGQALDPAR